MYSRNQSSSLLDAPEKFSVKLFDKNGNVSYLSVRDRTAWSKRVAKKHAKEFLAANPEYTASLEQS